MAGRNAEQLLLSRSLRAAHGGAWTVLALDSAFVHSARRALEQPPERPGVTGRGLTVKSSTLDCNRFGPFLTL